MFKENWYSDKQLKELSRVLNKVLHIEGDIIEIGCWQGRSTICIANVSYPEGIIAVDTWAGNFDEKPNHPTVEICKKRDVFAEFRQNIKEQTKGNVSVHKMDCFEFLDCYSGRMKFCHIDASHDYDSVVKTIEKCLPFLVKGGILCGDDYKTANKGRADLKGGVEKAVCDILPSHKALDNFWYYEHSSSF